MTYLWVVLMWLSPSSCNDPDTCADLTIWQGRKMIICMALLASIFLVLRWFNNRKYDDVSNDPSHSDDFYHW